ncbi:MAG: hypothetical protein ACI8ZM_005529 [Crocinitomix sp.]
MWDEGNDIVTDLQGNIYIAGEYYNNSIFPGGANADVTASSGGNNKSYLAKYDNCANLLWVAFSDNLMAPDHDRSTALVLDENQNSVYIVGEFSNRIHFNGGIGDFAGPASDLFTIGATNQGYIARFDMDDGTIQDIETVTLNTITSITSITVHENIGHIYIGGQSGPFVGADKIFIQRYHTDPSLIGVLDWTVESAYLSTVNLMDLDFDETLGPEGSVWATGSFRKGLRLIGADIITTTGKSDAYVVRIEDATTPLSQPVFENGNISGRMFGQGIVSDDNGHAFLTGYYIGMTTTAFNMIGGQILPFVSSTEPNAYFVAMHADGTPQWANARYGGSVFGEVLGLAVSISGDHVVFAGTYQDTDMEFDGTELLPYVAGTPNDQSHIFAVSYKASNGDYEWSNASIEDPGDDALHIPHAVATDSLGHAFITGGFSIEMGYLVGTPASGEITTAGQWATFGMRVELDPAGAFQTPATDANYAPPLYGVEAPLIQTGEPTKLKIYPNPASDQLTIELPNLNKAYQITLVDITGRVIMQTDVKSDYSENLTWDTKSVANGTYLILMRDALTYESIIIQHVVISH